MAKSEWPGGMMTPDFAGGGAYNTPDGSWLTGPASVGPRGPANARASEPEDDPEPMSTGRLREDAAAAASVDESSEGTSSPPTRP